MCPLSRCSCRVGSGSGSAAPGSSTRPEHIALHLTAARPTAPRSRPVPCSYCNGIRRATPLTASRWRMGATSRSLATTRIWSASPMCCRPTPAPCSPCTSWISPRLSSTTRATPRWKRHSPNRPPALPPPSPAAVRSPWWCTTAVWVPRLRTTPRCARISRATATSCSAAPFRAPTAARSTSTGFAARPRTCSFSLAGRTRTRSSTRAASGWSATAPARRRCCGSRRNPGALAMRSCCSTRHRTTTPSGSRFSNRWCARSPTASRR